MLYQTRTSSVGMYIVYMYIDEIFEHLENFISSPLSLGVAQLNRFSFLTSPRNVYFSTWE